MKFQIVIAMSGFGERFRKAGYEVPKPLIEVNGKPIIAHVLDMFPGEKNVFFICSQDHLDNPEYKMEEILKKYAPDGEICGIASHKLGPVYAVSKIFDKLDKNAPTIVNYCDFTATWDWKAFKEYAIKSQCDGAVMCYTGFHPHMLGCFNYAYVKVDKTKIGEEDKILAIQEKQPYTDKPMEEWASSGTYFFKNAQIMEDVFKETLSREDLQLKNEYYVSLAYRPMVEKNMNIRVFPVDKFCQWGTPEDLAEWKYHYKSARLAKEEQIRPNIGGICLIPMAGMGSRFTKEGYTIAKPLIKVQDKEMVIKAFEDLPKADKNIFVLRTDMPGHKEIENKLKSIDKNVSTINLSECTEGQAITCMLGLENIDEDKAVTIGACDNGLRYNAEDFS